MFQNVLYLRPLRKFYNAKAAISLIHTTAALSYTRNSIPQEAPALVTLKAERDPDKLFQLFKANSHNRLVIENRFAFEDTVSRLAGAYRFDYIEELLEHQKTLPQGRREGFIVRIIMLYGKAGMVKHSVKTFYDMHLYGCKRTVKSFNAVLKVLAQARDLDAMEELLAGARHKYDIKIDIFSVNIVIKAFCELGTLEKAYLVMVEMERLGLKPDVVTFTTLISAFYKNNNCEIANGLWNLMILKGCLPNLATFNVRIQYLINKITICKRYMDKGCSWQANTLMMMMQRIGIVPDEVTYNLVIKGFCQAGYLEMAKRVYSALLGKGYKPNIKIYQTMIHYLCKAGEFGFAYSMCKGCMQKNWFPNVLTTQRLLHGLKMRGELGKAKFILRLVREKVPPYTSEQYAAMESIFSGC